MRASSDSLTESAVCSSRTWSATGSVETSPVTTSNRVYAVVCRITPSSVTRTLHVSFRLRYSQRCRSNISTGAVAPGPKVTWRTLPARLWGRAPERATDGVFARTPREMPDSPTSPSPQLHRTSEGDRKIG